MYLADYVPESDGMESSDYQMVKDSNQDNLESLQEFKRELYEAAVAEEQYVQNIIRLSIMWTISSFCMTIL